MGRLPAPARFEGPWIRELMAVGTRPMFQECYREHGVPQVPDHHETDKVEGLARNALAGTHDDALRPGLLAVSRGWSRTGAAHRRPHPGPRSSRRWSPRSDRGRC